MRLFRIKADSDERNGLSDYLENHYVSYGNPGFGDMSQLSKAELKEKMAAEYALDALELDKQSEEHFVFAQVMQDGDYVIVDDGERMYLGDLGDYYYLDLFDNAEDRSGHRHGVTWLQSLKREDLHPDLLVFLDREEKFDMFEHPVTREQMDRLLMKPAAAGSGLIDEETIREALDILKAALRCDDAERRERAAIAILRAASLG